MFTSCLVALLAVTASGVYAHPQDLHRAASEAIKSTPQLRSGELKRQSHFNERIKAVARPVSRHLENGNNQQYNQQGYNGDEGFDYEWFNMAEQQFGFDITNYAVKFTGCKAVESFAGDADAYGYNNGYNYQYKNDALVTKRFATFRLCKSDACSSNSNQGCSSNYGEYVADAASVLEALLDLEEERVYGYCEYCQSCANIEAVKSFAGQVEQEIYLANQRTVSIYETWYKTYLKQKVMNGEFNYWYSEYCQLYGFEYAAVDLTQYNWNYMTSNNWKQLMTNLRIYPSMDEEAAAVFTSNQRQNMKNGYYNQYYQANTGSTNFWWQTSDQQNAQYWNEQAADANADGQYNAANDWSLNQNFWGQMSNNNKNQQNWNTMSDSSQSSSNDSPYLFLGTYPVQLGHFNDYNTFVIGVGYWNSQGVWFDLPIDGGFEWDDTVMGEMPEGIDQNMLTYGYQNIESCKSTSQCSSQYDNCMKILGYYQQVQYQNYEEMEQPTIKDFVQCTKVGEYFLNENMQDKYAQQYLSNKYYQRYYGQDEGYQQYRQYQNQNNQNGNENNVVEFYVGPACDGDSLTLGVFTDEMCSNVATGVTLENILSFDPFNGRPSSDMMPNECISCSMMDQSNRWYENEEYGDDGVHPFCSMLYYQSGKCNRNLEPGEVFTYNPYANYNGYNNGQNNGNNNGQNGDFEQMYQSWAQAENEEQVCGFIDSLNQGTYDESGKIFLGNEWLNPSNWGKNISVQSKAMSGAMKFALILSALAVVLMAVYACHLTNELRDSDDEERSEPTAYKRDSSDAAASGPSDTPLI